MARRIAAMAVGAALATGAGAEPPQETPDQPWRALGDMFRRSERVIFSRTLDDITAMVLENEGLYSRLAVSIVGQYADRSLTSRHGLLSLTYDLDGAWRVFGDEKNFGGVTWWVQGGGPIGAPSDADLSTDVGSGTGVNETLDRTLVAIEEVYWGQRFDTLGLSAGRVDPSWRYDFNAIANDERESFLAGVFGNSPTIPFPEPGVGLSFNWDASDLVRFKAGVHQANSRDDAAALDELRADELFWAFEAIFRPRFKTLGAGTYRVTAWYNRRDSQGEDGAGLSFSFDQEVGPVLLPFLRYGIADRDASEFRQSISIGLGIRDSFGRPGDLFGAAWSWTEPSDPTRNDEQVVEIFNRFEVTRFLAVTPDLQVIIHPADNTVHDVVVVVGVRAQFDY